MTALEALDLFYDDIKNYNKDMRKYPYFECYKDKCERDIQQWEVKQKKMYDTIREAINFCEVKKEIDTYDIWPLSITVDRYNGSYSGGKILAINDNTFPQEIFDSDNECSDFWSNNPMSHRIGIGNNQHDAIMDLKKKLR